MEVTSWCWGRLIVAKIRCGGAGSGVVHQTVFKIVRPLWIGKLVALAVVHEKFLRQIFQLIVCVGGFSNLAVVVALLLSLLVQHLPKACHSEQ